MAIHPDHNSVWLAEQSCAINHELTLPMNPPEDLSSPFVKPPVPSASCSPPTQFDQLLLDEMFPKNNWTQIQKLIIEDSARQLKILKEKLMVIDRRLDFEINCLRDNNGVVRQ